MALGLRVFKYVQLLVIEIVSAYFTLKEGEWRIIYLFSVYFHWLDHYDTKQRFKINCYEVFKCSTVIANRTVHKIK